MTVFHQKSAKLTSEIPPQRDRVIGQRNDRERADHERQAKPDQAVAHLVQGSLAHEAWPHEQPEEKKNIAMKKLSVASTMQSKPIQDLGSVWPK